MNRSVAAVVFSLLFAASLTAAETRRFIVATNHPFAGGKLIAALQDSGAEFTPRGVLGFQVIDGFAADLTDDEAASLRKSPQVRYVVETVTYRAMGLETNDTSQIVPYGIDLVHARDAWAAGRLGGTINVVVIDTGVDYRHPELAAIFQGGKDLVNKDDDPLDDQGHGTHVSGTIAAADNTVGVVGIAPQVRLWSAKVLGPDGSGTNDNAIAALDWIIAKKEQLGGNWILNLSLGSSDSDPATAEAFQKAVDAGLFIVAASGNESIAGLPAPVSYPAAYPGVIAVGAIDQ
ncbi:MAG TPA: S8 family serine peptidase, partial [Thermoanaerobaculia bacterium]|nr:S8 family serine peptidase [Thermoanaerobaculia bacterium]